MYYTGKGDQGTSKLFQSKERRLKSDLVFEVLGSLDELNSWLGFCAIEAQEYLEIEPIIKFTQNNLFICQAYFAQADKPIPDNFLVHTEEQINLISPLLKERKTFVLSGGSRLSSLLDVARTLSRRVERRAVELGVKEELNPLVLAYLNRLSSLLYVLARWANDIKEVEEQAPEY